MVDDKWKILLELKNKIIIQKLIRVIKDSRCEDKIIDLLNVYLIKLSSIVDNDLDQIMFDELAANISFFRIRLKNDPNFSSIMKHYIGLICNTIDLYSNELERLDLKRIKNECDNALKEATNIIKYEQITSNNDDIPNQNVTLFKPKGLENTGNCKFINLKNRELSYVYLII